jgi:hypothetical protein
MRFPAASFGTIGFAFSPFDALQKIPSGHLDLNGFLAARVAVLACPIPLVLSRRSIPHAHFPSIRRDCIFGLVLCRSGRLQQL